MEKERLERMLEAVKEIKAQYYVGTSEAWNFLKANEKVYQMPICIAQQINEKLGRNVSYTATPGRIAGVYYIIEDARKSVIDNGIDEDITYLLEEVCEQCDALDFLSHDITDPEVQDAIRWYYPFFRSANVRHIQDDEEFPPVIAAILKGAYSEARNSLEIDRRDSCDNYVNELISEICQASFVGKYERFRRWQTDELKHMVEYELRTSKVISRLRTDRFDNVLEYRRNLLAKILTERSSDQPEVKLLRGVFESEEYIVTDTALGTTLKRDYAYFKKAFQDHIAGLQRLMVDINAKEVREKKRKRNRRLQIHYQTPRSRKELGRAISAQLRTLKSQALYISS